MDRRALLLALFLAGCEAPEPTGRRATREAAAPAPSATIQDQAKQYAAASAPGNAHRALEPLVGEWDVTLSTVAQDGGEGESYRGRATLAWTLGGRFLRWDAGIAFGELQGTTTGFLGFNTRTRQYQMMMISDLATGMEIARGGGDLRGTGIVLELEQIDPETEARLVARSRIRSITPDHFVLEQLEATAGGKDRVTRAWHYRRAGAPTR